MATKAKAKPAPDPQNAYAWREGARFSADPQRVGEALDELASRLGKPLDGLTADDVVEVATDPASPLHGLIEWDNAAAATEWRLHQARQVLNSIRVVVISNGEPTLHRGRVVVRAEGGERLYVPLTIAARNEATRSQMVADARAGLNGWLDRYRELAQAGGEFGQVFEAIAEAARPLIGDVPRAGAFKESA